MSTDSMVIDNMVINDRVIDSNTHPATPYQIYLAQNLTATEQEIIITHLQLLPVESIKKVQKLDSKVISLTDNDVIIKQLVDGRGLACPMPLLKTKVALRNIALDESLYIMATDPNSQADIIAFCQQTWRIKGACALQLIINESTAISHSSPIASESIAKFDTIFHFIITKTDSN